MEQRGTNKYSRRVLDQAFPRSDSPPKEPETLPNLPEGWVVCSCLKCKSVLRSPIVGLPSSALTCPCGAELPVPAMQFAERLFGNDESAKSRILNIDLTVYDELATYPASDVNWPLERRRILFVQAALRIGIPWVDVVQFTSPHFGQTLNFPPVPGVVPVYPLPFTPPAFDIARQTPEQWGEAADAAWRAYRTYASCGFREQRNVLLKHGVLRQMSRSRRSCGIAGRKKAPITDESAAFTWAALHYFSAQYGNPLRWPRLAELYPAPGAPKHPTGSPAATKAKRKRAEQIRIRALEILQELNLAKPE